MIVREGQLLVFGGCYSNLQATEALLDRAESLGIPARNMVCTGDIIAYGADAHATLGSIRRKDILSIAGNCELQLSAGAADCGCGFAEGSLCDELAAAWYAHAVKDIDGEDRRFMAALPGALEISWHGRKLRIVHGNVERINAFVFPSAGNLEIARQLALSGCDAVVAGHSGIPFTRRVGARIWHNAGSIGMPANDGTRRGWFSLLEVVGGDIVISSQPLDYDYAGAARAMRRHKLPEGYAAALETGIWPSLDILPAADRLWTGVPMEARQITGPAVEQNLQQLETIWINTGTLCNLACENCFMESSPTNDALAYFTAASFNEILAQAPATVMEIGFTGGEPFMNPDIVTMLEAALVAQKSVLVLTNAMRPMQRHMASLRRLFASYPKRLAIRVSIDHYKPARHDALRGADSFTPTLTGLKRLAALKDAKITAAARTPWGETEAMLRLGFSQLFATHGIALSAQNPAQLILFPEMDFCSPAEKITPAALAAVPKNKPLMCATSRMAVLRKGETQPSFTPCTLLPHHSISHWNDPITLDHPHCAQFCVYGGASCAGAPG